MLKKYALLLFGAYAIVLAILSLVNLQTMPSLGSSFDDKVYHCIAYLIFAILCYNFLRTTKCKQIGMLTFVIAVVYGIVIEVLQGTIAIYRTLDIYDMIANTVGVIAALGLIKGAKFLKLN